MEAALCALKGELAIAKDKYDHARSGVLRFEVYQLPVCLNSKKQLLSRTALNEYQVYYS